MLPKGLISPEVAPDVQASVFSIFDDKKKLQYVGFSKDLRGTLRTVFSRRPDKAFYYKAQHLQTVDQKAMITIRDGWFEEVGGAPPGNKLAMERVAWQQPVDAGAISQRGKLGAAEEKLRQLQQAFKDRGCKEEFIANTTLLMDGQVDFLPSVALSPEEVKAQKERAAALAKLMRKATAVVDGQKKNFSIFVKRKFNTNGGCMMDVAINFDNLESNHRIVVGKDYYEPYNIEPEAALEAAFGLLFKKKLPRQTEGMLLSSQFPVNYFSISELEQWFEGDFKEAFETTTGKPLLPPAELWRFSRVFDYGAARLETSEQLNIAVGKKEVGRD